MGDINLVVDKQRVDQSRVRLAEVEIGDVINLENWGPKKCQKCVKHVGNIILRVMMLVGEKKCHCELVYNK